jgi:hypothetical protein
MSSGKKIHFGLKSFSMESLAHLQWRFYEKFYYINYLVTLDLIIMWHCIYEERDETSFMEIKPVQLIFYVLKTM